MPTDSATCVVDHADVFLDLPDVFLMCVLSSWAWNQT